MYVMTTRPHRVRQLILSVVPRRECGIMAISDPVSDTRRALLGTHATIRTVFPITNAPDLGVDADLLMTTITPERITEPLVEAELPLDETYEVLSDDLEESSESDELEE